MLLAKHYMGKKHKAFIWQIGQTSFHVSRGRSLKGGHTGLCVSFTYIHMNANKCEEYLSFTAYKSLHLVKSDLQVRKAKGR